jgi:hypothetical protein
MQVLFINNDGGGFADRINIPDGMTVAQLFTERLPHGQPQDYLIRVNRQPSAADTVLQEHDRVSITPTKIEGAESPPSPRNSEGVPCERALPINNCIRLPCC